MMLASGPRARFVCRFLRSDDGVFSIITAIMSLVLITAIGLAVDLGSVVYWQRRLQAATDTAALAATFDLARSGAIAANSLEANGSSSIVIEEDEVGVYVDDPAVDGDARFTAGPPENAVRLATRYDVPVYFIRALTGFSVLSVSAESVAYNLPLAGFTIGTAVAESDEAQVNDFMEQVSGTSYNLTDAELDALDQTSISIFRLFDRFAALAGSQVTPMASVLTSDVDLATVASAAASALSAQAQSPTATQTLAINALTRIAQDAGSTPLVTVADFVALGAHQQRAGRDMVSATTDTLAIPALSILMGYLHASRENTLINQSLSVPLPGLATIDVDAVLSRSALGGGGENGMAAIGPEDESVYSSKGRVRLTVSLLNPIAINVGLINLSLPVSIPIVIDLGYGGATISEIACGSDIRATTDITVTGQSGAARIYIGSVTDSELADMVTPLTPDPAQLINTPLVKVTGQVQVDIAQSGTQTLHFSYNDIQAGTVKSIDSALSSEDALALADNTVSLVVTNSPALVSALVSNLLRAQVSAVLAALEPELDAILASLGLTAGTMDVRATAVRCGIPALVT